MSEPQKRVRTALEVMTVDLRGRTWRLDAVACQKFVALLRAGNYPKPAAEACGVSPQAVGRWRKRGDLLRLKGAIPTTPPISKRGALNNFGRVLSCIAAPREDPELWLVGFAEACREAEAEAEAGLVVGLRKAAAERPELAVKLLERRYPDRWAAKPAGPAVQVTTGHVQALTIYAPPEVEP